MQAELPPEVHSKIERQHNNVKAAHDSVRDLEKSHG
jgi:hypothetical protein